MGWGTKYRSQKRKPRLSSEMDARLSKMMARVFMAAYRRGVNDGYDHSDNEGLIREHIGRTDNGERFGYIDDCGASAQYWVNRVLDLSEKCGLYKTMLDYVALMGRFRLNYFSAGILLVQLFYNKGLEDYISAPGNDLARFNNSKYRMLWTENGLKKIDMYRVRAMVQDICARRSERIESEDFKDVLKQSHYDIFSSAFSFTVVL